MRRRSADFSRPSLYIALFSMSRQHLLVDAIQCTLGSIHAHMHAPRFIYNIRGDSKKSYEKLLVVSYTMRAMGLHRLAETAAALLKARTGLVLDWCPAGGVKEEFGAEDLEGGAGAGAGEMQEVKVEVKEEGNGEEKGAAEILVKMEGNNEAAGGGLKKVKSEQGLPETGVELVEVKEEVPEVVVVARRSSRGKKDVVSPVSAHS